MRVIVHKIELSIWHTNATLREQSKKLYKRIQLLTSLKYWYKQQNTATSLLNKDEWILNKEFIVLGFTFIKCATWDNRNTIQVSFFVNHDKCNLTKVFDLGHHVGPFGACVLCSLCTVAVCMPCLLAWLLSAGFKVCIAMPNSWSLVSKYSIFFFLIIYFSPLTLSMWGVLWGVLWGAVCFSQHYPSQ